MGSKKESDSIKGYSETGFSNCLLISPESCKKRGSRPNPLSISGFYHLKLISSKAGNQSWDHYTIWQYSLPLRFFFLPPLNFFNQNYINREQNSGFLLVIATLATYWVGNIQHNISLARQCPIIVAAVFSPWPAPHHQISDLKIYLAC